MTDNFPKLVILAGGESSRLWPLREKSLLTFLDKPVLEHQLETCINLGFRDIIVVCNQNNQNPIKDVLRKFDPKITSRLFVQAEARGMGDALLTLEPILSQTEDSVAVYVCQVHDIFDEALHRTMLQSYLSQPEITWLAGFEVQSYFPGGYLVVDDDLNVKDLIEKPPPGTEPSNLVNIVAHMHPDLRRLLARIKVEYSSNNLNDDHYERAMANLMGQTPFKVVPYKGGWYPIKYPWHVLDAMTYYLGKLTGIERYIARDAQIEDGVRLAENEQVYIEKGVRIEGGVYISGPAYIGQNVRIFHGADIRGPVYIGAGSLIGQNSVVRESMISENSVVGLMSEVNRSYVGRGTMLHNAMFLDSIAADSDIKGKPTNLSARMVTANFRADAGSIRSTVKNERLDTGRHKFGAVIGGGTFVGIGAELMPGVKIGENCVIGASTLVLEDVLDNTRYYVEQNYIKKQISDLVT